MSSTCGAAMEAPAGDARRSLHIELREYEALRSLASRVLRREGRVRCSATSLVHEAYLRLSKCPADDIRDSRHLYVLAARTMRRVLIDRARRRLAASRRGRFFISIDNLQISSSLPDETLLAVDGALEKLSLIDSRKHDVVLMRFFGGMTIHETAAALKLSPASVKREWALAKAWLTCALNE